MTTKKLYAAQTVATRLTSTMTEQLTVICPLTGLLITNDLPAALGLYINSYHPLAFPDNARQIIKNKEYWLALNKEHKAALILSVLDAYNHLSLEAPSIVVKGLIETNLNVNQLNGFLEFMQDHMTTTQNGWPVLSLGRDLNEHTFLDYMNRCAFIEYNLADEDKKVVVQVPKFVTSDKRGVVLDKESYEEWLDAAQHLPKDFVSKAGPFVRTLATNPSKLVDSLLAVVESKALTLAEEVAPEVVWFLETAEKNRETAKNLGLHNTFDDLSLFDSPNEDAEVEVKEEVNIEACAKSAPVESTTTTAPLSPFAARLAALKSKQL